VALGNDPKLVRRAPASGKSHLSAAFGHALIENGYRVLFTRTTDLVQRLQRARQALSLESAIEKLDKYHLLILEDLCYVRKDQAETSVLFELIAARYERRSLIVTSDHPFGEWTSVFPNDAMTFAVVDLTTPLIFHPAGSCADSQGFRTRSGDFVDERGSWGWKRRNCAIADG
jgi:DNA replication protein DnaC